MQSIAHLERELSRELAKGYYSGGIIRDVRPRDLFYIILYLLISKKVDEALYLIEYLAHHQIKEGGYIRYIHGGHSPKLGFRYEEIDPSDSSFNGAFPTIIKKGVGLISGYYPDIDSTSLSLAAMAKTIQVTENKGLYERYREVLIKGLEFLNTRDSNDDLLLEQLENEDWADSLLRNGCVLYSNATYLIALDWIYEASKFFHDKKLYVALESKIGEVGKKIVDRFWQNDHFIEYIDGYGGRIDRAALDTSLLAFTSFTDITHRRMELHMEYLHDRLSSDMGLSSIETPQKVTRPNEMDAYRYQNGGIIPLFNIAYHMSLREIGSDISIDFEKLLRISRYLWVGKLDGKGRGEFFKPSAAFLIFVHDLYSE